MEMEMDHLERLIFRILRNTERVLVASTYAHPVVAFSMIPRVKTQPIGQYPLLYMRPLYPGIIEIFVSSRTTDSDREPSACS